MNIPPLKIKRYPSSHAKYYSKEEELVYYYLFFDKDYVTNKLLDNEILKIPPTDSHHGFVSMRFLHHIGLNKYWKGIFKGKTIVEAIDELKSKNDTKYAELIHILNTNIRRKYGKTIKGKRCS